MKRDLVIIGAGPAGMAAAIKAREQGIKDIVIIERAEVFGGVLQQCIHNGFGLTRFKENLTGPEYSAKFEQKVIDLKIETLFETTVIGLTDKKVITAVNSEKGIFKIQAKAVILAMGCRERSRGAINIPGERPAGVMSAGTAQRYVNIKGLSVGKNVVILGSGDIGLIMARRMTLEGAKVHAVIEIMSYSSGLKRNIAQCLNDFEIPLYLNHTVTGIKGAERVEGVTVSKVGVDRKPIIGTEFKIACDTLLLSVGLVPENELSKKAGVSLSLKTRGAVVDQTRETSVEGIFACGNVLQVHDLVDFVSEEAEAAGCFAAEYIKKGKKEKNAVNVEGNDKISYVLPQKIDLNRNDILKLFFRVNGRYENKDIVLKDIKTNEILFKKKKSLLVPGEMETLVINNTMKDKIKGGLILSVEGLNG